MEETASDLNQRIAERVRELRAAQALSLDALAAKSGVSRSIVIADEGKLMGFASYGALRPWPAYKYTVEHSLYVAKPYRRQGVGTLLLRSTIERATSQDYHVLVGGIDSTNAVSIALHERFGFEHVATMRQVGFKFGRWLGLCFYQLTLKTPAAPVDG